LGLSSAATVQLGHYYGFSVNVYGFSTNAHTLDAQNAFERGLNAAIPALAGADELSGIGEMEAGVMGSFAQMVLDNELVGSVQRLRKGLSADAEHLAVNIILDVMNGTRNFLGQKHTMKHLRGGEMALTKFAERNSWDTWEEKLEPQSKWQIMPSTKPSGFCANMLSRHWNPNRKQELDKILAVAERKRRRRSKPPVIATFGK
jgi:trimethylamine:corrinoid methyltransferase-like protein